MDETVTSSDKARAHTDHFDFDRAGNRVKQVHTGPAGGAIATTTFQYNGDNQLKY